LKEYMGSTEPVEFLEWAIKVPEAKTGTLNLQSAHEAAELRGTDLAAHAEGAMTEDRLLSLDEPLLDAQAVAGLLGVEADTVYAWARSGNLPYLRLGARCLRWTRPLLEEWLTGRLEGGRI
jgi:excisionase family DNA binding protein